MTKMQFKQNTSEKLDFRYCGNKHSAYGIVLQVGYLAEVPKFPKHNGLSLGDFNTLHRAGGRAVNLGAKLLLGGAEV